jgi:hypothetical protein
MSRVWILGRVKSILYERRGELYEHKFRSNVNIVTDGKKVVLRGKKLRVTWRGLQD